MCSSANSRRCIYDIENNNCKMCNLHLLHGCGEKINSALTKESIDDENLFRYIAKCCPNFARVTDAQGKTALHMVSSTGRYQIAEWLINHGALIDFKDQESGDTALHRAIYYGCIDCAVLLISYGADIEIISNDYLNPMQVIWKIFNYEEDFELLFDINETNESMSRSACGKYYRPRKMITAIAYPRDPKYMDKNDNELLVWGTNKNYNLGTGKEEDITYPQFIDYFKKHNINITSMAISSYHSLFLDDKNQIYSVGHGGEGRLGNDSQNILTLPTKIEQIEGKKIFVIQISCAKNHSLVLTSANIIYSCGKNNHCQLGYEIENNKSTEFKMVPIKEFRSIFQIIAKEKHSVAVTRKSVYVWGTNNGQFSSKYANVKQLLNPRPLQIQYGRDSPNILSVSSSNTAIACLVDEEIGTSKVLLFYNHVTKFIKFPFFDTYISSICLSERENQQMTTKKQNRKTEKSSTTPPCSYVEMLIKVENSLYIWNEITKETHRCVVKMRNITFEKILFKNGEILVISDGEVYQGTVKQIPLTNNSPILRDCEYYTFKVFSPNLTDHNKSKISTTHEYNIELKNLLHFDRVKDIFCDDDFKSFGLLQDKPTKYYKVPEKKIIYQNFSFLLNDSSEFHEISDVVIHVNTKEYYCHKFIIFLKSSGLKDIINKSNDKKNIYINYKYLSSKMFELILKHIYEDYFLSEQDFVDISNTLNSIDYSDYKIEKNHMNMECFDFLYLLDPKHISVHAFLLFLNYAVKFELEKLIKHVKIFAMSLLGDKKKVIISHQKHEEISFTLFPELYDVTIICEENIKMKAHKCILVRSEYFRAALKKCWSVKNVIKLETVQYEYILEIINFLYTPNVENFRKKDYPETFLYKLIVICDQFLIEDLRNVCEIILAEKISIKKCGDLLQFAHTYNCYVLEKCCLDFICQNLRRVLIHKSLEVCKYDAFKKINEYYRKLYNIPVLKPYSHAIDDLELLKFVKNFNVELFCKQSMEIKKKSKIKNINKFEQSKRECEKQAINSTFKSLLIDEEIKNLSISSDIDNNNDYKNNSMDIKENDEKDQLITEKWKKVNDKRFNKKHPKTSALECAIKCNYILKNEKQEMLDNDLNNTNDSFTILNNKDKIDKNESVVVNKNLLHSYNFGDLLACNKIEKKTSQKQRKLESKLTDESNLKMLKSNAIQISKCNNDNYIYNNNQWNLSSPIKNDDEIISFADIIKSPKNSENLQFKISPKCNDDSKFSSSTSSTVLLSSSVPKSSCTGAIPKKRKINSERSSDNNNRQQNNNDTLEFSKILEDEKRQKKYCEQLKNKSFALTQVEDTAISELEKFYNADNVFDEDIKIKIKTMPITRNFNTWQHNKK